MNREIRLFDDPELFWAQVGKPKILSMELDGGLFRRDFDDKARFFACLATRNGVPDFAEDRLEAEALALRSAPNHPWSYTFDDLYEGLRGDAATELSLLTAQFEVQPQALALLEVARSNGAMLVANCEGPFSEAYWRALLAQRGIEGFSLFYTSIDTRLSKKYYGTFRKMLADTGLPPGEVFHFGSVEYNDLNVPLALDMRGALVVPARETLGGLYPHYKAVSLALQDQPGWEAALLDRAIEKALFAQHVATAPDPLAPEELLDLVVLGPVLMGFMSWVSGWIKAKDITLCIIAAPEISVVARLAPILLRRAKPSLEVQVIPPSRAAEYGVALRDLDTSQTLIVSCDTLASGAGTMVARNPLLAMRPALHFMLVNSERHSLRDVCYFHSDGIPAPRAALGAKCEALISRLFVENLEAVSAILPMVGRFIVEWARLEKRYPELKISRSSVVSLLEAVKDVT